MLVTLRYVYRLDASIGPTECLLNEDVNGSASKNCMSANGLERCRFKLKGDLSDYSVT